MYELHEEKQYKLFEGDVYNLDMSSKPAAAAATGSGAEKTGESSAATGGKQGAFLFDPDAEENQKETNQEENKDKSTVSLPKEPEIKYKKYSVFKVKSYKKPLFY